MTTKAQQLVRKLQGGLTDDEFAAENGDICPFCCNPCITWLYNRSPPKGFEFAERYQCADCRRSWWLCCNGKEGHEHRDSLFYRLPKAKKK